MLLGSITPVKGWEYIPLLQLIKDKYSKKQLS
jgi:hypothetical protein